MCEIKEILVALKAIFSLNALFELVTAVLLCLNNSEVQLKLT